MIKRLKSGGYRLYSRKKNPATGKRRNLGTFKSRTAAEKHEREVQYFKRH
jgi:cell division septation protein DedD